MIGRPARDAGEVVPTEGADVYGGQGPHILRAALSEVFVRPAAVAGASPNDGRRATTQQKHTTQQLKQKAKEHTTNTDKKQTTNTDDNTNAKCTKQHTQQTQE